jgi:hypothetical protein
MVRWRIAGVVVTLAGLMTLLAACAGTDSGSSRAETFVPIQNIQAVVGKWSGILDSSATGSRREDLIELTIGPDASYRYSTARTIGVLQGSGTLTLKDGQLTSSSERGSATYRLYDRAGKRILKVEAVETRGVRYTAELTR